MMKEQNIEASEPQKVMRDSNMELLRLISIFLVVLMHVHNTIFNKTNAIIDISYLSCVNSFANVGVTIFMLISGFYGIKTKGSKIWRLWSEVFFWGLIGLAFSFCASGSVSPQQCLSALLPISSGTMWFATGYMIIALFACYINALVEILGKERMRDCLVLMFVLFCFLPSFVGLHISGAHHGRTVANLFFAYMVGRYIRLHVNTVFPTCKILVCFGVCVLCVGISNLVLSVLPMLFPSFTMLKNGIGLVMPFARNCSVFIFVEAVCLFLLFRKIRFSSRFVNALSPYVFAVYLLDPVIRPHVCCCFDFVTEEWGILRYMVPLGMAIVISCVGLAAGFFRRILFGRLDDFIGGYVVALFNRVLEVLSHLLKKSGL